MNRSFAVAAVAMILATAAPCLAQRAPGSAPARPPAASGYHPAPASGYHPAPPAQRPAPSGFSFPHETGIRPITPYRPPVHTPAGYHVAGQQSYVRSYAPRAPYASGPYHYWRGPVIANRYRWPYWGWNHGVIWYPAPYYWGGGFWGPWAIGVTGAALFGSVIDYGNYAIYPSYEIGSGSPGAQLLYDYGLTQTECGPPNLVVIWGPDNSVICAYPNDMVAPGNYELDPATLSLTSLGTQ
jgi:hypothetical protein